MHLESHAGLAWAIGVLTPGSDRRLRWWAVLAGMLPDIDASAYLFGDEAYMNYHHTFGHNVFLGVLVTVAAGLHGGRGAAKEERPRRALLVATVAALCFASHILTDMKLSAYPVVLFWPASRREYELTPNLGLGAPINTWLVYASAVVAALLGFAKGVTPLDLISPRLDRIFTNAFRRKTAGCSACARKCNELCDGCLKPVCLRCGRVSLRFRVACPACALPRP
jgi:inner membrane protein